MVRGPMMPPLAISVPSISTAIIRGGGIAMLQVYRPHRLCLLNMQEKQTAPPKDSSRKPEEQPTGGPASTPAQPPDEYDRRGIKLPARTLVGGIITPV